jgi:hypothetical protein
MDTLFGPRGGDFQAASIASLADDFDDISSDDDGAVSQNGRSLDEAQHSGPELIDVTEFETANIATMPPYHRPTPRSLLDSETELSNDVVTLQRELQALRVENDRLTKADLPGNGTEMWPTLHIVSCPTTKEENTYMEQPFYHWMKQHDHLRGHRIVQATSWERRHPEKPFVVYVNYDCVRSKKRHGDDLTAIPSSSKIAEGPVTTTNESVHITSPSLFESLKEFFATSPILKAYWAGGTLDESRFFRWPYPFFHHVSDLMQEFKKGLKIPARRVELGILIEYFSAKSVLINREIKNSIAARQIHLSKLPFLFAPGTLLVTERDGVHTVVCQKSVMKVQATSHATASLVAFAEDNAEVLCSMEVSEVHFDGRFWAQNKFLEMRLLKARSRLIAFDDLNLVPLMTTPPAIRESLVRRGRKFFSCCSGLYVTCDSNIKEDGVGSCTRYMVDADAYRIVHRDANSTQQAGTERSGMEELFPSDDPEDEFLLRLPPRVRGFNMQTKTWSNVLTAGIEPVIWDKAAFGNLAIDADTKELIEALIRNKIESDQSIDFVKGKGTGLIVLLHGGPGTGKTLTAETVAEIAERPLYRVTCGAMGTTATEVETNLGSVFHLGRRWGCVVLLDEADVFLEERALSDLARNALVSVFLRVIEYFDGIMILTSNRVATFDEAFKSRIQLALHYQALNEDQRRQIWESFIRNLETVDEPSSINNIKSHLVDLSKYSMNGRQIRNAINTARQLARFKGEPLDFEHLRRVIKVSGSFDEYVRKVKDCKGDDELARELFIR